jgi:inosine-uridine nucleoside N-ribohydrolase
VQLHVDTDFGGDPDDACALAMLLGWPGVEIVGITTNLDAGGTRAGCAAYVLELAGRASIPAVAGAECSLTTGERFASTYGDERCWPASVVPAPAPPGRALVRLRESIDSGATIVAIGALTNLAQLEQDRPGSLRAARIVAMAGWLESPPPDLPQWGAEMDFNVQCDTRATEIVAAAADALTLVTLPAAMHAQLRARDLPRLRAAGPVGALLARQSEVHALDGDMAALARAHAGLPDDLVNFHWDPVTAAVAAGWDGATLEKRVLACTVNGGVARFVDDPAGRPVTVVTSVDHAAFGDLFLACIEARAG